MIYIIEHTVKFGREGIGGVQCHPEHNQKSNPIYAHSLEQAFSWVKSQGAFENIPANDLHDGRFIYQTEWLQVEPNPFSVFFPASDLTHTMQSIIISSVPTVYE